MKKPIANDYAGKVWMHKVNPSDGIIFGELRFRSCKSVLVSAGRRRGLGKGTACESRWEACGIS